MLQNMLRSMATLLLAGLLIVTGLPAASRYMPIDDVKAGMEGVGRTVFLGDTVEEFKVHILGTLKNANAPQRDLILARLEGGPLARTGVIAGMSGSPVFIDGRMIGAVSYSLGQFSSEPIAGITPIAEMISATGGGTAPARRAGSRWTQMAERLALAAVPALPPLEPFDGRAARLSSGDGSTRFDAATLSSLRPIAIPLVAGGFDLDRMPAIADTFRNAGFVLTPGGARAAQAAARPTAATLKPGDPIGIALVDGDLSFGATGTVTEVDGTRVYAFGHPFYNVGPASFPMTRAYVHAVLPSLMASMKLASMGEVVGTIQQDRSTGVAGTLGLAPGRIPMAVSLNRDNGATRTLRFDVAVDPLLSPLLLFTALFNTISAHERDFGAATYALQGRIRVAGQPAVDLDEIFVGDQPGSTVSAAVALPAGALLNNDRESVEIAGIDVAIAATEKPRTATIERAWFDGAPIRRGREATLNVLLRTWRGENVRHTIAIPIPLNVDGALSVLVTDGPRLAQWEARDGRPPLGPESVATLIRRLNEARHANRVYVRLLGRQEGALVGNEHLPALPASVLSVLASDRAGGGGSATQQAVIGAWDIKTTFAVSGQRTLTVPLDGSRNRP